MYVYLKNMLIQTIFIKIIGYNQGILVASIIILFTDIFKNSYSLIYITRSWHHKMWSHHTTILLSPCIPIYAYINRKCTGNAYCCLLKVTFIFITVANIWSTNGQDTVTYVLKMSKWCSFWNLNKDICFAMHAHIP